MPESLHPPPSVIASWPIPNYVNPTNRGPALEYVCIIFSVFAIVIVSARVYLRLFITRAAGWDDFLIVVGLVFSIAMSILIVVANKLYFSGRHIWDVPLSTITPHRINIWVSQWLFVLAGTAIKVSVLLFYRRLSVKFTKGFLIATWIGIVYNVLYLVAFTLVLLLICSPVDAYWNEFSPKWAATHKFHCANEGASVPTAVALSVLGDFYSTVLPLVLIFGLPLPLRQKLALYSLFALGFLACGLGVLRVFLMNQLLNESFDFTWLLWEMWILSVVELYAAMFAASAPALKPFFHRFISGTLSNFAKYSKRRGDRNGTMSFTEQEGKSVSSSTAGEVKLDIERIGVAYAGDEAELRERVFWKDIGHQGTRRLEMRSSQDGKMVPMQVLSPDVAVDGPGPVYDQGRNTSKPDSPIENWPMTPPRNRPLPRPAVIENRLFVPSQASQQTIHVGLQLEPGSYDPVPALGSVKAARLHAGSEMKSSYQPEATASGGIPESIDTVLQGSSNKRQEASIRHGANAAMHKTALSINRSATVKSNIGVILSSPTRSRDFDPERRQFAHTIRDGYMI